MKPKGPVISPPPLRGRIGVRRLVEDYFTAYNAARLQEACRLLAEKVLRPGVTVGVSLSGALTPAGLAGSALVPLIRASEMRTTSRTPRRRSRTFPPMAQRP